MIKRIIIGILVFALTLSGILYYNIQKTEAKISEYEKETIELDNNFNLYAEYNDKLNIFISEYINTYVNTFGVQKQLYFPEDFKGFTFKKLSDSDVEYFSKNNKLEEFNEISKKNCEIITLINEISDYYSNKKYQKDFKAGGRSYHQKFLTLYNDYKKLYLDYKKCLNEKEIKYLEDISNLCLKGKNEEKAYKLKNYMFTKIALYYTEKSLAEIS